MARLIPELTAEAYAKEKAICTKATAYATRIMAEHMAAGIKSGYLTAEEASHPDYAACDNDMRGRVEQYELLTDTPEKFTAYLDEPLSTGAYPVVTWTGHVVGHAQIISSWVVRSYMGTKQYQYRATVNGRQFVGRGFGRGMYLNLRETAASKRKRTA
jgi:hypothetical protein